MYIEFIGVSGAGKTTIVEKTAELLEADGISCITRKTFFNSKKKKGHKLLWTVLNIWRLDLSTLSLLWRWGVTKSFKNASQKAHEYIKMRYLLQTKKRDVVALWDSEFVQLFSKFVVAGFVRQERALKQIQKRLPNNCLLVFLDTSIDESLDRKRKRAKEWGDEAASRLEVRLADENIMKDTHAQKDVQEYMLHELQAKNIPVVTLDGMLPPKENASLLTEEIKKRLHE